MFITCSLVSHVELQPHDGLLLLLLLSRIQDLLSFEKGFLKSISPGVLIFNLP